MREILLILAGMLLMHGVHLLRDRIAATLRIRRVRRAHERLLAKVERRQVRSSGTYPGLPRCDGSDESAAIAEAPTKVSEGGR